MPERDHTSWNTVIYSIVKESEYGEAFELLYDMWVEMQEGFRVDYFTLFNFLIATARSSSTIYGRNLSVTNALIPFDAKCGGVDDVESLFSRTSVRDGFSWNEMVNAYMGFGLVNSALDLFPQNAREDFHCLQLSVSWILQDWRWLQGDEIVLQNGGRGRGVDRLHIDRCSTCLWFVQEFEVQQIASCLCSPDWLWL